MGVAVVGEHHAGLDGDEVVAAVPLLALESYACHRSRPPAACRARARRRPLRRTAWSPRSTSTPAIGVAGMQDERLHARRRCRDRCVTTSRSAKVKTVSRCMAARSLGMPATITLLAAPAANSLAATWVMACRDVRSLIPMMHDPVAGHQHVAALDGGHAPTPARDRPTTPSSRRNRDGTRRSPSSATSRRAAPARTAD